MAVGTFRITLEGTAWVSVAVAVAESIGFKNEGPSTIAIHIDTAAPAADDSDYVLIPTGEGLKKTDNSSLTIWARCLQVDNKAIISGFKN